MQLVCRFCGKQNLNIDNLKFRTNKEAEEYATLHCDCEEGEIYRNLILSKENLDFFLNSTAYSDEIKAFFKELRIAYFRLSNGCNHISV